MNEVKTPGPDVVAAAEELIEVFRRIPRMPSSPSHDLTLGQVRLLYLLRVEGPLPMGRIAEIVDLSPAAATGFVGRVERHRFVERRHRSDDRRVVECALTPSGEAFLDELSGMRADIIGRALGLLSPAELEQLRALLRRIIERQGTAT